MLRYFFNGNTAITITNDFDITIFQEKNPATQDYFANKDEAIAWATDIANDLNMTIMASEEKIVQPTDVEVLQKQVADLTTNNDSLKTTLDNVVSDNELLKGCVMELASIVYA